MLSSGERALKEGNLDEAIQFFERAATAEGVDGELNAEEQAHLAERLRSLKRAAEAKTKRFECFFHLERCSVYRVNLALADTESRAKPERKTKRKRKKRLVAQGALQLLRPTNGGAADSRGQLVILRLDHTFQLALTPAVPVLTVLPGRYVFPSPEPSVFFGLMFDEAVPRAYCRAFETLVASVCSMRRLSVDAAVPDPGTTLATAAAAPLPEQPPPVATSLSARALSSASAGVTMGSRAIVKGVGAVGSAVSAGVERGGQMIKARVKPATHERSVPEPVRATVGAAKKVTPHLVYISNAVLSALVDVACATGQVVGERVAGAFSGNPDGRDDPSPAWQAAKDLGRATLEGAVDVWEALDAAGVEIYQASGDAAVGLTEHRYGKAVAEVTRDGVSAGRDVLETVHNVRGVVGKKGAKRLARKMAKSTATQAVKTYFLDDQREQELLEFTDDADADQAIVDRLRGSPDKQLLLLTGGVVEDLSDVSDVSDDQHDSSGE